MWALNTQFFKLMYDHLGITAGPEMMALLQEFSRQFLVIVDLSIINNGQRAVLVEDRLVPALDIYDAEPPHPYPHGLRAEDALVIRPSMPYGPAHLPDHPSVDGDEAIYAADYPAHGMLNLGIWMGRYLNMLLS